MDANRDLARAVLPKPVLAPVSQVVLPLASPAISEDVSLNPLDDSMSQQDANMPDAVAAEACHPKAPGRRHAAKTSTARAATRSGFIGDCCSSTTTART